jgi:putative transposase
MQHAPVPSEGAAPSAPIGANRKPIHNQAGTAARPPTEIQPSPLEGAAPSAPLPSRRRPAHHPAFDQDGRPIIVFLTVCTHNRKSILAQPDVTAVLRTAWATAQLWRVGRWVLMPDHLHLFCAPATNPPESIKKWLSYWKSEASRHWPRPNEHPIWQRDFWDTQLRPGDDYAAKWEYVRQNPVRAGLATRVEAWPYQGEENVLMWVG